MLAHTPSLRKIIPRLAAAFVLLAVALAPLPKAVEAGPATGVSYKITTQDAGIYQINYADLVAAGFNPAGVDPATFQLFNFGQEVALHLVGTGDGSFDAGDYFLFYAEKHLTRYTDVNIYWFVAGEASGLRMASFDATPAGAPIPASFWRTIHFEQNKIYKSEIPLKGDDADRWYWQFFQACPPGSRTCRDADGYKNDRNYVLDVPSPASETYSATLTMALRGAANEFVNPDHHVTSSLNTAAIDNSYFDGTNLWVHDIDFDASHLLSGANALRLQFPDDLGTGVANAGYINYFELRYRSTFTAVADRLAFAGDDSGVVQYHLAGFTDPNIGVFRISDPKNPVRATNIAVGGGGPHTATLEADNGAAGGAQLYAVSASGHRAPISIQLDTPSSLRAPGNRADYLVITHADFMAQAQQLASHRQTASGLSTYVIDAQDIYDEFNNGLMDPAAIRDFVFYATHHWLRPYPAFVVTFGDGHYDFLHATTSETVFFPPWLAAVDPFQGETAADNRYVDIYGDDQYDSDGDNAHSAREIVLTDGLMDLHVDFGYIPPVAAAQQVSAMSPDSVGLVKAIGDMVFWDEDADGIYDSDERGAPGITVNLWRGASIERTQQTDANGGYYFEDISSGTYRVEFVLPTGWQFSPKQVGDDDRYDSDVNPGTGYTDEISYTYPQQAMADWDAGILWPGTIGNRVWSDTDGDGLQDDGEPGIAGVLVNLLQNNVVIDSQPTDANGYYFFHDKPAGTYDVQIDVSNFDSVLAGHELSPWDQGFDTMPDLKYGRFPVNTVAQAADMVNRVIQYETNSPRGDWQKRTVFVADNPDAAGDFWAHSNEVADHIWPYAAESLKVYFQQTYNSSADMKTAIKSGIDQGALFVTYNGHSSKNTWGDSFMTTTDIDALTNTLFPIFLPMTCLEGQFLNPGFTSMGEKSVRTIGKGAVASFSPTGLGVATGHQFMFNSFFEAVTSGETELGALTVDAKRSLFQSHSLFRDLMDTYVLLGDPALQVQMPDADVTVEVSMEPDVEEVSSGQTVTYTVDYSNQGGLPAENAAISITLSSTLLNPQITGGPVALAAASLTASPTVLGPGATEYDWNLGTLAPGAGGTITVVATVGDGTSGPPPIGLDATITASNDADSSNNDDEDVANAVVIGGFTWSDINGNGLVDATESNSGVPHVAISVLRLDDNSVTNTVSDASGHWSLAFMPTGTYDVTAQVPTGLGLTTSNPQQRTLLAGQTDDTVNFGYASPTAVELADFRAEMRADGVGVQWQTISEQQSSGFYIWRSPAADIHGKRISPFIASTGSGTGASYSHVDAGVSAGAWYYWPWYYWLEAVDNAGGSEFFGPVLASPPDGVAQKHKVFLGFVRR